ncbi:YtxH domain-containing protein [Desulfosporosinus sp. SB140]|uniref:YtxH domain-containing protein n=1 Tax=Desulfosporosinus paludis TaxID=3115649 RepID=UPI00388DEEF2
MPKNKNIGTVAIAALVGGAAGAFVSLMIAPKSGKALRKDIQNKAEVLIEQVEDSTSQHAEVLKQKSTDLINKGKKIKTDLQMLFHDLRPNKVGYIDLAQSVPEETSAEPEIQINPVESSEIAHPDDIETLP